MGDVIERDGRPDRQPNVDSTDKPTASPTKHVGKWSKTKSWFAVPLCVDLADDACAVAHQRPRLPDYRRGAEFFGMCAGIAVPEQVDRAGRRTGTCLGVGDRLIGWPVGSMEVSTDNDR